MLKADCPQGQLLSPHALPTMSHTALHSAQHIYHHFAGALNLSGSKDLNAWQGRFSCFAEQHQVRTGASQSKLHSENEILVPNTQNRSQNVGLDYRKAV